MAQRRADLLECDTGILGALDAVPDFIEREGTRADVDIGGGAVVFAGSSCM
jgi:hypothetical protein